MGYLGIKSKLLAILLGFSTASIAILAVIGYYLCYQAPRDSINKHLTSLRSVQADRIESYLHDLEQEVERFSAGPNTREAMKELVAAYRELDIVEPEQYCPLCEGVHDHRIFGPDIHVSSRLRTRNHLNSMQAIFVQRGKFAVNPRKNSRKPRMLMQ